MIIKDKKVASRSAYLSAVKLNEAVGGNMPLAMINNWVRGSQLAGVDQRWDENHRSSRYTTLPSEASRSFTGQSCTEAIKQYSMLAHFWMVHLDTKQSRRLLRTAEMNNYDERTIVSSRHFDN